MTIAQLPEEERLQVFAELNGYDEADKPEKPEVSAQEPNIILNSPSNASQSIPLVDDEDLEDAPPLSKSSFLGKEGKIPKLYLMVGAAFFVIGFTAFQSYFLTGSRKSNVTAKDSAEIVPEEETEKVFTEEEAPIGEIKSELALQSQAQQLKQLNEPNPNIPPPPPKQGKSNNTPAPTTVKPKVPQRPSPPTPQPQRVAVRRVTPLRTPVVRQIPQPQESVKPGPRQVPSLPPVVQTSPQDPQAAWLAAAQIGSYGSVTSEQSPVIREHPSVPNPSQIPSSEANYDVNQENTLAQAIVTRGHPSVPNSSQIPSLETNYELNQANTLLNSYESPNTLTADPQGVNPLTYIENDPLLNPHSPQLSLSEQELPILQERASVIKHIPMGATVRGQIDRAVAWEGSQSPQTVQIRLLKPLLDETGEEIAYEGSFLIVQINGAGESGLVSMTAKTLITLTETGEYREISLTPASIDVAKSGGHPLMAQRLGNTDEPKRSLNMGQLMLDGVSTALPFFSDGNNGYQDLYRIQQLERFYQRNFAQQSSNQSRPNVRSTSAWMLPAGLEVEIYVNQTITIKE